jgi:hypothetical protein
VTTFSVPPLDASQGKDASMLRSEMTPTEEADRLAIGELVDEPTQVLEGREALTPVFDELNRYVDWTETRASHP